MHSCSMLGSILITLFGVLLLAGSAGAETDGDNCNLSVGWEPWKPYQYRNVAGDLTGLDIELVRTVTQQMGCSIRYQKMPWQRTLFEIEQGGLVNMAAGADKVPQRIKYAYFSEPYREETVYLFVRSDDAKDLSLTNLSDIARRGFSLGITAGYHYGEHFDALMQDPEFAAQVETVRADRQNYEKLLLGRIDGFLADPVVTAATLRGTDYVDRITAYPMNIKTDAIHVMFSRNAHSPEIVTRFNNALEEVRDSGRFQEIMDKYLDY